MQSSALTRQKQATASVKSPKPTWLWLKNSSAPLYISSLASACLDCDIYLQHAHKGHTQGSACVHFMSWTASCHRRTCLFNVTADNSTLECPKKAHRHRLSHHRHDSLACQAAGCVVRFWIRLVSHELNKKDHGHIYVHRFITVGMSDYSVVVPGWRLTLLIRLTILGLSTVPFICTGISPSHSRCRMGQ